MPIVRRTRLSVTTYGVLHWLCWSRFGKAGAFCGCCYSSSNIHKVHTDFCGCCYSSSNIHKVHTYFCGCCYSSSNIHKVHTYFTPASPNHCQHNQCRTPYVVTLSLVLLTMGIMMPKHAEISKLNKHQISCILLVFSLP
jgi:hypothetical protein